MTCLLATPARARALLRLLLANAGEVLATNDLLDAVWGEEFAGAAQILYVHMGWLRAQIEENPRCPRYIQTVRGVGYKFVAHGGAALPLGPGMRQPPVATFMKGSEP